MYQKSMYCAELLTGASCVHTGSVTKGVLVAFAVEGLWALGWRVGMGRGRSRLR